MLNFMKIRPVEAELFQVGGRTDRETGMTKSTVAFRNFENAPKMVPLITAATGLNKPIQRACYFGSSSRCAHSYTNIFVNRIITGVEEQHDRGGV